MSALGSIKWTVGRQAAVLTVAVWSLTFVLFLLPSLAAYGRVKPFGVAVVLFEVAIGIVLSGLLYWIIRRTKRAMPRLRIPFAAGGILLVALAYSLFEASLGGEITQLFMAGYHVKPDFIDRTVSSMISFSWLYGWLGSLYAVLHASDDIRKRDLALLEARSLAQTAQMTALRLQLNPHFLFNTLNAISSLIITGRITQGEQMLSGLSEFLRATLLNEARETTSLAEELEMLQRFLAIEMVRFGDRLDVEFEASPDVAECRVPSFILQPLVENAVKHAVAPSSEPVLIRISARGQGAELRLVVSDHGPGGAARTEASGMGLGLDNIRHRLAVQFGGEAALDTRVRGDGFTAEIRLPRRAS